MELAIKYLERTMIQVEDKINELTLLLLYLTSWTEKDLPKDIRRSWKGYPFDTLNELTEKDLISGSIKAKSVYLTKEGIKEAEKLVNKYLNNN